MRIRLSFALASLLAAHQAAPARETGALDGRVLPAPGGGLVPKTVWVGAVPAAVLGDGSFRADAIPAGPAELGIETSEGLYLVRTPVAIAPGTTRHVQLAFGGRQDSSAPPEAEKDKKKKRGGIWAHPATATLIVIGSAIVVGFAVDQLTNSDGHPVSPSSPTN